MIMLQNYWIHGDKRTGKSNKAAEIVGPGVDAVQAVSIETVERSLQGQHKVVIDYHPIQQSTLEKALLPGAQRLQVKAPGGQVIRDYSQLECLVVIWDKPPKNKQLAALFQIICTDSPPKPEITSTAWTRKDMHEIVLTIGKTRFQILILRSGAISVYRTLTTYKNPTHKLGRTFWSWREVHDHYKQIQPHYSLLAQHVASLPPINPNQDYAS